MIKSDMLRHTDKKTTSDLGGIAKAAGEVLSQYGGSLAKYLNISDATEAVKKYNQDLISSALRHESVSNAINKIEQDRINALNASLYRQNGIQQDILKINKLIHLQYI